MSTVDVLLGTELFQTVELYLGDGLVLSAAMMLTFRGETVWSLLSHIIVLKCMSFCQADKVLVLWESIPLISVENGHERKKIMYVSYNGLEGKFLHVI